MTAGFQPEASLGCGHGGGLVIGQGQNFFSGHFTYVSEIVLNLRRL